MTTLDLQEIAECLSTIKDKIDNILFCLSNGQIESPAKKELSTFSIPVLPDFEILESDGFRGTLAQCNKQATELGFRLPTPTELLTIWVCSSKQDLKEKGFGNKAYYAYCYSSKVAYKVDFGSDAQLVMVNDKDTIHHLMCVRHTNKY